MTTHCEMDPLEFPAKTVEQDGSVELGISVFEHGLLAAYVLQELIGTITVRDRAALLPPALVLLCALHDIGKISPSFVRRLLDHVSGASVQRSRWESCLQGQVIDPKQRHALVSQLAVHDFFRNKYYAAVVGGHHGLFCSSTDRIASSLFGGQDWQTYRKTVLEAMLAQLAIDPAGLSARDRRAQHFRNEWTGLIAVSDWIASQEALPVSPTQLQTRARELVQAVGFTKTTVLGQQSFQAVFSFPARTLQEQFGNIYEGPGVYVLEAPTGYGKTEAALWLAYQALQQGDAGGIYFALPTQLTSNRIFTRFSQAVARMTQERQTPRLIHGGARLQQARTGEAGEVDPDWFSTNRKAILSAFGVGTVDQALLSILPIRFGSIRAAGLVGKVVIFDEIHSYDGYTSHLLQTLIGRLQTLGAVVIVLSATLTQAMRCALLAVTPEQLTQGVPDSAPARITVKTAGQLSEKTAQLGDIRAHNVRITLSGSNAEALAEAVRRVRAGQQVLWIENTVRQAQAVYQQAAAQGLECGLIHSHFRTRERRVLEDRWTALYGKAGHAQRPCAGRLLIGTQVLEQSLDLDADYMVTRLAPMDLLIQRFGRLWRHQPDTAASQTNWRPQGCDGAQACVLICPEDSRGQDASAGSAPAFGTSAYVYSPYVLYRTREVLYERAAESSVLALPFVVSPLLEAVYAPRQETDEAVAQLQEDDQKERERLNNYAQMMEKDPPGQHDDSTVDSVMAQTRFIRRATYSWLILDADWQRNLPVGDMNTWMLWCENQMVKLSDKPSESACDTAGLPALVQKLLSRCFGQTAVAVCSPDGALVTLRGEAVVCGRKKLAYFSDCGVVESRD